MSIQPTTSWICDSCGELIERPEHGWVEWVDVPVPEGEPKRGREIRIVHHFPHRRSGGPSGCQFRPELEHAKDRGGVADYLLQELLGFDGLMILLEKIKEHRLPTEDLLEIIKRLHIPGYEHARQYFTQALAEGVIELDVEPGFYRQDAIQRVLEEYTDLSEGQT